MVRYNPAVTADLTVAHFNGLTLDTTRRALRRGGTELHLTRKAFDLLALLVSEAPRVLSKDELHRRLWPGTFVTDATLAGVVKELRRALGDSDRNRAAIRTVHGVGYAFDAVVTMEPASERKTGCWLLSGDRRLPLIAGANDIGRDRDAAISLDAAESSRRHARIVVDGASAFLEDLNSKNGTLLNERLVSGSTPLADGDTIRIGSVVFVFHVSRPQATTATAAGRWSVDA